MSSDNVTMVRILHGLLFPQISRCQNTDCYLGRNLRGVRLQPGTHLDLVVCSLEKHEQIVAFSLNEQKEFLMDALSADGRNIVGFTQQGVLSVIPKEDE